MFPVEQGKIFFQLEIFLSENQRSQTLIWDDMLTFCLEQLSWSRMA